MDGDGLVKSSRTSNIPGNFCGSNTVVQYTQTNTYDARHQLKTMARGAEDHTYVYDDGGNLTA